MTTNTCVARPLIQIRSAHALRSAHVIPESRAIALLKSRGLKSRTDPLEGAIYPSHQRIKSSPYQEAQTMESIAFASLSGIIVNSLACGPQRPQTVNLIGQAYTTERAVAGVSASAYCVSCSPVCMHTGHTHKAHKSSLPSYQRSLPYYVGTVYDWCGYAVRRALTDGNDDVTRKSKNNR